MQDIPNTEKDTASHHKSHNQVIARFLIADLPHQLIHHGKSRKDRENFGTAGLQTLSLIH